MKFLNYNIINKLIIFQIIFLSIFFLYNLKDFKLDASSDETIEPSDVNTNAPETASWTQPIIGSQIIIFVTLQKGNSANAAFWEQISKCRHINGIIKYR